MLNWVWHETSTHQCYLTTEVLPLIISNTMQLITTVTSKGQVVIPKSIRDRLNLRPFSRVVFSVVEKKIVVESVGSVDQMKGFIKTQDHHSEADFEGAIEEEIVKNYAKLK